MVAVAAWNTRTVQAQIDAAVQPVTAQAIYDAFAAQASENYAWISGPGDMTSVTIDGWYDLTDIAARINALIRKGAEP
jgi:predicted transglutaminase-like cysteine proteinase